jgi:hypothetical protein
MFSFNPSRKTRPRIAAGASSRKPSFKYAHATGNAPTPLDSYSIDFALLDFLNSQAQDLGVLLSRCASHASGARVRRKSRIETVHHRESG